MNKNIISKREFSHSNIGEIINEMKKAIHTLSNNYIRPEDIAIYMPDWFRSAMKHYFQAEYQFAPWFTESDEMKRFYGVELFFPSPEDSIIISGSKSHHIGRVPVTYINLEKYQTIPKLIPCGVQADNQAPQPGASIFIDEMRKCEADLVKAVLIQLVGRVDITETDFKRIEKRYDHWNLNRERIYEIYFDNSHIGGFDFLQNILSFEFKPLKIYTDGN